MTLFMIFEIIIFVKGFNTRLRTELKYMLSKKTKTEKIEESVLMRTETKYYLIFFFFNFTK